MVEEKKGRTKAILLTIIGIILVLIIISLIYIWKAPEENPIKKIINSIIPLSNNADDQSDENANPDYEGEISSSDGGSGEGGSGGGSGGGGEDTPGTPGCQKKQIPYSMVNVKESSNCLEEIAGICINKNVFCSIEIHNRDSVNVGEFKVKLSFAVEGEQGELESDIREFSLNPIESYLFEKSKNIQSTGENGPANKQINCFYNTLENPSAEVCN